MLASPSLIKVSLIERKEVSLFIIVPRPMLSTKEALPFKSKILDKFTLTISSNSVLKSATIGTLMVSAIIPEAAVNAIPPSTAS